MMCKVLIFSCISVAVLMTTAYGASLSSEKLEILPTLIKDLGILEKSKNEIHLELYTPNEIQECSRQTLQCYLEEMVTLEKEIEDEPEIENEVENALQSIKKNLQRLRDLNPIEGDCKICEANDKKNFPDFLQQLTNFLRSMQK
ncbi:interleukin-15-like [Centrocercus urophasianus]|nr:interleukin-15-like [Centrocercus urophasianus]XP_042727313.1 interleukin-15-like [Lagopus leucura]